MRDEEIRFFILFSLGIIAFLVAQEDYSTWISGVVLLIAAFIIRNIKVTDDKENKT